MDRRASLGGQRPRPPQRAVSGGSYGLSQPAPKRPTLSSGLSTVRSISQPVNVVDLTSEGTASDRSNTAAYIANAGAVVKSPDVINVEQDDGEPPAKRAKVFGESFRAKGEDAARDESDKANYTTPGSPLPTLPNATLANRNGVHRRQRFTIEPASRKFHGIDPPTIATRIPGPKKAADFSPWTGNHPEDVLNENVIKTGFFDKLQGTNQAESNSAKATISSSLSQKNSHGLALLGYMFTAVMEKRQVLGKCTTPSAFKPPPRVTVTDTKREAWLRDLANPDVPLRKQSRTIPHGIRGKLLMEQCLGKNVPLQRAVWLAKCVGANELRAFRRKGVSGSAAASGEVKWVREWTVHVEQFLEDVVASCGQEGWQRRMNYSVRLVTAFYAEKLLDLEHYLDWIVTSFADAAIERLPVWIVLVQVFWKEITMYGRRGRKLAEAILEQLHRITMDGVEANGTLKIRLQKLVTILAVTNRGCLIIPRTWEKYKYLLAPASTTAAWDTPAKNITKRNERLAGPLMKTAAVTRSPLLDLYAQLDAVGLDVNSQELASRSLQLVPDISQLCSALLDWACTRYRTGISRVYLAANVIAQLRTAGYDTDSAILQYLGEAKAMAASSVDHVQRVIVELCRKEAFSVSRYLQWLISSGLLSTGGASGCATQLLIALKTSSLPLHVRNLRNTLMRRLGYSSEDKRIVDGILLIFSDALSQSSAGGVDHAVDIPTSLSLSSKFELSQRICATVGDMAKEDGISLEAFVMARAMIERVEDLPSLAALIASAISTDNSALLATVSDTVNLHAESLAAVNEFSRLVDALTEQYLSLRSQQPLDRILILALTSLTQRIPEKAAFVKLLTNDLTICEQQYSLAVCSPASDSVIGMQASSLDSDDDIDAVFASGNTMDEQLMQRVFTRIVQRAQKPARRGSEYASRITSWLSQLRSVEGSGAFEDIVQNYVRDILTSGADAAASITSVVYLVVSGCLDLGVVADNVKDVTLAESATGFLPLFLSTSVADVGIHDAERYRFRLRQSRCRHERAEDISMLVSAACKAPGFNPADSEVVSFVTRCASTESDVATHLTTALGPMKRAILMDGDAGGTSEDKVDIREIVTRASPLSIQFCMAALASLRSAAMGAEYDENTLSESILEVFYEHSVVWPQLVEVAGESVNRMIHEHVQERLLMIVDGKHTENESYALDGTERLLELLAVTNQSASIADDMTVVATITERLKNFTKLLSELHGSDAEPHRGFEIMKKQLQITLHLCMMHVHGLPSDAESTKQGRYNLLAALCALLVHPRLQTYQELVEHIFDLASTLADNLPDEAHELLRQHHQISGIGKQDPRLTSILGVDSNATDSWLALASQTQPPGSQQQRALNKHASQQQLQQSSGRPLGPGQSQQDFQPQHQRVSSHGNPTLQRQDNRIPAEMKVTPFPLRQWEIMPEVMGENNTSLDLKLFGARKV